MTKKRRNFDKGVRLRPDTTALTEEGELKYDDSGKKIQYRDDAGTKDLVSETTTQTLQNKTIDATAATGDNTLSADAADIEYDNSTSGLTATELQAAIDELDTRLEGQDQAIEITFDDTNPNVTGANVQAALDDAANSAAAAQSTADTGVTNASTAQTTADDHIADAVDAHDASAISNVPAGNLAATDVQGALDELQTDVDTRSLASDLTTHEGDTSTHGVGEIVGTTETQTLTNKTIQGASLETPSRSDSKQDTKANLATYASTASNGQTVYATDTKEFFVITDNALVEVGGGIGDVDYLTVVKDFDTSDGLTTEITGVNDGTFRLTHDATITKFAEVAVNVTNKFKDKVLALRLDRRSTASSGNFKVIVTDETNGSLVLADEVISPQTAGLTTEKKFVTFSTAPKDGDLPIQSIKVRFEALAEAGAPFSEFDDVVIDLNTTEKREITATVQETNTFSARIANNGTASITSQSESFISSVTRTAAGQIEINFKSGYFTVAPAVSGVAEIEGRIVAVDNSVTTSQVLIDTQIVTGSYTDCDFTIQVSRQGSDYKNIEKRVEREVSTFHEILSETQEYTVEKILTADNSTTGDIGDLQFNGLEIGEWYDVSGQVRGTVAAETVNVQYRSNSGGTGTLYSESYLNDGNHNSTMGVSFRFKADSTSLYVRQIVPSATPVINGNGTKAETYLQLTKRSSVFTSQVAPDSKIEIPTSELRMEGHSGNGTGVEAGTIIFKTVSKISGDGVSLNNSNGTIITVQKDGLLNISASVAASGANRTFYISLNTLDASVIPLNSEIISSSVEATSTHQQNFSANLKVKVGDVLRVWSNGTANNDDTGLTITHQEQRIQVAISNITPQFEDADSMVRLHTSNGYGSTNTAIPRFSTILDNIGSDVTYTDSATNGASFTIEEDGYYSISTFARVSPAAYLDVGISLNSTQLTTGAADVNVADILTISLTDNVSSGSASASWSGILTKGDVVRPHYDGVAVLTTSGFTIAKVGVPSIAEVDVTPFVDLNK